MSEQNLNKVQEQLNLEQQAVVGDWDQERLDSAKEELDRKYPDITDQGISVLEHYEAAKKPLDAQPPSEVAKLALAQAAEKSAKIISVQESAARNDWSQDKLDSTLESIENQYAAK